MLFCDVPLEAAPRGDEKKGEEEEGGEDREEEEEEEEESGVDDGGAGRHDSTQTACVRAELDHCKHASIHLCVCMLSTTPVLTVDKLLFLVLQLVPTLLIRPSALPSVRVIGR